MRGHRPPKPIRRASRRLSVNPERMGEATCSRERMEIAYDWLRATRPSDGICEEAADFLSHLAIEADTHTTHAPSPPPGDGAHSGRPNAWVGEEA